MVEILIDSGLVKISKEIEKYDEKKFVEIVIDIHK